MSKSNATENDYVKFEANAVAMPSYGATLQLNLHTADPGEAGNSDTNVATYTGYAPVVISRDASGLTICDGTNPYAANASGNAYKNTDDVIFPESSSGPEVITHVSISKVGSAQQILRSTALTASLTVNNLVTPLFPAGTLIFAED